MQQCSGGGAPHGNADKAKGDDDVAAMCQSIAGPPVDEAIGMLVAEQMTPPAVELALEVRKEIQARHEEADRLRCRATERAQTEAELAQRRFVLVDPGNRLVAAAVIRSMPGGDGAENPAVAMAPTLKRAAHIESPGEHHRMDANCAEFGTR